MDEEQQQQEEDVIEEKTTRDLEATGVASSNEGDRAAAAAASTDVNSFRDQKRRRNLTKKPKKSQIFEKTEEKLSKELLRQDAANEKQLEDETVDRMNLKLVRNLSVKREPSIYDQKTTEAENVGEKSDEQKLQDLKRAGEMKNEIETLKYRLNLLKEEFLDCQSENSTLKKHVGTLNKNLNGHNLIKQRLENQIQNLKDKIMVREKLILKNDLVGIYMADPDYEPPETIGNGILISNKAMRFINQEGIEKQLQKFHEIVDSVVDDLGALRVKNSSLDRDIIDLKSYIQKIDQKEKSLVDQYNKELTDAKEQFFRMESNFNKSRRLANTLSSENDQLKSENERMIIRNKGLEEMNSSNSEIIKKYKQEILDLKRKVKQAERD